MDRTIASQNPAAVKRFTSSVVLSHRCRRRSLSRTWLVLWMGSSGMLVAMSSPSGENCALIVSIVFSIASSISLTTSRYGSRALA